MHFFTFLNDAIINKFDPVIIAFMYHFRDELERCNINFWKEINVAHKKKFSDSFNRPLMSFICEKYNINTRGIGNFIDYKNNDAIGRLPDPEKVLLRSRGSALPPRSDIREMHYSFQYMFCVLMCNYMSAYYNNNPDYNRSVMHDMIFNYVDFLTRKINPDTAMASIKHAVQVYCLPIRDEYDAWQNVVDNYGNIIR